MVPTRAAIATDIERCAAVLARAFDDDPGTRIFEPDSGRRAAFLPEFFRSFVAASLAGGGKLIVPVDAVDGVASWFGPDVYGPTEEALLAHGFGAALDRLGTAGSARLAAMVGEIEAQHDERTRGRAHGLARLTPRTWARATPNATHDPSRLSRRRIVESLCDPM